MKFQISLQQSIFCILLCLPFLSNAEGKYFEGQILYKNSFVPSSSKYNANQLLKRFGNEATLYFKEGNYLEMYDSGLMREQRYDKTENRIYYSKDDSDTLHWFSASRQAQRILRSEIHPKKEVILGIECDELVNYYVDKTISLYYNSDTLQLNPEWFVNFNFANKNTNTEKMKSLYLKYKIEATDYTTIVTAVSIRPRPVDDNLFAVPESKILVQD
ncbi:MAG: hypothetical protein IPI46_01730 [Bacteroidetes bacterium]|nr:hypothetical protein [Bacteroidota bacterium]